MGHQNLLALGALSSRSWLPILEALVNCKKRNVNCNLFTHETLKTRLNVLVRSRQNWNWELLVRRKPEYPEKNLSEQGRESTTNLTQIWRQRRDFNPSHSPLCHPCSPESPLDVSC